MLQVNVATFFYIRRKIVIFVRMKIRDFFKEHTIGGVSFVIFATLSVALLALSFILPPTGTIDPSVLSAVGELFAFASLGVVITAIGKGRRATVRHNDTELTIEEQQKTEDDGEL